jgi:predicted nuclease with TOPRIM domain
MMRKTQGVAVVLLAILGIWGCTGSGPSAEKAKEFEVRVAKLEADLKTVTVSRDQLKARLSTLEDQVRAESERAKLVEKERDDLIAKVAAKSAEKDSAVAQYDDLVKKLEGVLGQAKVAQNKAREGANAVPAVVTSRVKE